MDKNKKRGSHVTSTTCIVHPDERQREKMEGWLANCGTLWNAVLRGKRDFCQTGKDAFGIPSAEELSFDLLSAGRCVSARPDDIEFSVYRNLMRELDGVFARHVTFCGNAALPFVKECDGIDSLRFDNNAAARPDIKHVGNDKIWIRGLGEMKASVYDPLPEDDTITNFSIKRTKRGRYLLHLVCERVAEERNNTSLRKGLAATERDV
ncbi:MAG: hypothetical protein LUD29_02860 [Clostridia bacterium]|nr:hypothetical protein [Clostridia bacterium]